MSKMMIPDDRLSVTRRLLYKCKVGHHLDFVDINASSWDIEYRP